MLKENYNLLPLSVLVWDYVCFYVPVRCCWSDSRASGKQTILIFVNRWGHILAELTGWSHGLNSKCCFVSYLSLSTASALLPPSPFLPSILPSLHNILFCHIVLGSSKKLKSNVKARCVTSWFNSKRSCVYFTFCLTVPPDFSQTHLQKGDFSLYGLIFFIFSLKTGGFFNCMSKT